MARTNTRAAGRAHALTTFEGTPAKRLDNKQALRRSVMTCLLWEPQFYETGNTIAARIRELVADPLMPQEFVEALAVEAREAMKLRHVPLFLVRELARRGCTVASVLERVIQRPDEITEFLSIYWMDRKPGEPKKIAASVKRGLAAAFRKFDAHTLAKYNQDGAIKLRDVLFLVHAKPKAEAMAATWKQLVEGTLPTPDTWETELSAGKDKNATFSRLIQANKLGALAMLRNLRNMQQAKVPDSIIREGLKEMKVERVLPFRFIAAARFAPMFEPELEAAMFRCVEGQEKLPGKTALIVDTSPSMWQAKVSAKSDMTRFDAAAALAVLCRETCESVEVFAFNEKVYEVPSRRGFALRDALAQTQGGASCGGAAVLRANERGYDRIIVLTDGEWHYTDPKTGKYDGSGRAGDSKVLIPSPLTDKAYLINVASYTNAVGSSKWEMIDGWSEAILTYIRACEMAPLA